MKASLALFALLVSSTALASTTTCVAPTGIDGTSYGIVIQDRFVERSAENPHLRNLEATKDVTVHAGSKQIGSFAKAQVEVATEEGYYFASVMKNGAPALQLEVNGRDCLDDLCPALWTQPGLRLKQAKAVCKISE